MEINIKNESQQLINNFRELTGEDKTTAIAVMSTGTEEEGEGLFLACSGVGSMLLEMQAAAIVITFEHLVQNGSFKEPQISAVEFLSNINKSLLRVASTGATNGKD